MNGNDTPGTVGGAFGGLFTTLINGISATVDNAVTEAIGSDDVQRTQTGPVGTPARDTFADVLTNPVALIGLGIVGLLLFALLRG